MKEGKIVIIKVEVWCIEYVIYIGSYDIGSFVLMDEWSIIWGYKWCFVLEINVNLSLK